MDRGRLSNLPDCVILYILSFLEMQERVKLSHTSKKLRELFCESLKELNVNLHGGVLGRFLSSHGFCSLESLFLTNLTIDDDNSFGEGISYFCIRVKDLWLENIDGIKKISISSSSLERLSILASSINLCNISISANMLYNLQLHCKSHSSTPTSLKINAPKLVHLTLAGYLMDSYCLEGLNLLRSGAIYLTLDHSSVKSETTTRQNFSRLLQSINMISNLSIYCESIRVLFHLDCLSLNFCNLSVLTIYTNNFNDDLVPAMGFLLKRMSNLHTLHIQYEKITGRRLIKSKLKSDAYTTKYWESQNLPFVHQLKEAAIEVFLDGENELELVRYLLTHAGALAKMTILCMSHFIPRIKWQVDKWEKPSSTAEIVFVSSI